MSILDETSEQIFKEAYAHYTDKEDWKIYKEGPHGSLMYTKSKNDRTIFKIEVSDILILKLTDATKRDQNM